MRKRAARLWASGLVLLGTGAASALSLRGPAAELSLGDVRPGSTVRASRVLRARPRFENPGPDPVTLSVKAAVPPAGGLADGYEPWPYPERVRLSLSRRALKPGEAAELDVELPVPFDASVNQGQYQVDALASAKDPLGRELALRTRVLVSVGAPVPDGAAEPSGDPEAGFSLSPRSARVGEAALGRRVTASESPALEFKLVNAGAEDAQVSLSPAWAPDGGLDGDGYSPAPNPRFLRVEPESIRVPAGRVASARASLLIPRQARYAGRRWTFAVWAEAKSVGGTVRRRLLLRVETEGEAKEAGL